jgi:hypothetical protein
MRDGDPGVKATGLRTRQETLAARRLLQQVQERFGIHPESLGADMGYGSGEFLAWLLERQIQPHIPVIDRRHEPTRVSRQRLMVTDSGKTYKVDLSKMFELAKVSGFKAYFVMEWAGDQSGLRGRQKTCGREFEVFGRASSRR